MKTTKKLGLISAISVCIGLIVATSCLLMLGQGMDWLGVSLLFVWRLWYF